MDTDITSPKRTKEDGTSTGKETYRHCDSQSVSKHDPISVKVSDINKEITVRTVGISPLDGRYRERTGDYGICPLLSLFRLFMSYIR